MFVVLTGIDGCGKSTQAKLLQEKMPDSAFLKFPNYDSVTGRIILGILQGKTRVQEQWKPELNSDKTQSVLNNAWDPAPHTNAIVLQSLMTVNRLEMVSTILRWREQKRDIICDRYDLESSVYGITDGLPGRWCSQVNKTLPKPDIYVLLDIDVEESFVRRPERADQYESSKNFLSDVNSRYRGFFLGKSTTRPPSTGVDNPGPRYCIVNGSNPVEMVHQEILALVSPENQLLLPFHKTTE